MDITPCVDIAFKKIFGVEENKDLLISLINAIVGPEDQVEDLTILNPYNPQNFRMDKLSILDIKARGHHGKLFNIEIQITDEGDYDKRALYYWGKMYTQQLQKADHYKTLSKAIGIHILNFFSIPESPKYHNVFHIREKDAHLIYFKDLELHTIELRKFCDAVPPNLIEIASKVTTSLDVWAAFLTRHDLLNKKTLPGALNTPALWKALDVLEEMNLKPDEREMYEDHLKYLRDIGSAIHKKESEAFEEGKLEGRLEVARKLLSTGLTLEAISACTGLSVDELGALTKDVS
jgi:predicted transposase/invertase (TIGR01784 family)